MPGFILPNKPFEAGRCGFYFSVFEIQAQVSNGIDSEQIPQDQTRTENRTLGFKLQPDTWNATGTKHLFQDPWMYENLSPLVQKPAFAENPHQHQQFPYRAWEYLRHGPQPVCLGIIPNSMEVSTLAFHPAPFQLITMASHSCSTRRKV